MHACARAGDDSLETVKRNEAQYGIPLKILSYKVLQLPSCVCPVGFLRHCTHGLQLSQCAICYCLMLQYEVQLLSYRLPRAGDLYGWTMDEIVAAVGHRNNCTFCGVFRRQALDPGRHAHEGRQDGHRCVPRSMYAFTENSAHVPAASASPGADLHGPGWSGRCLQCC